MAMEGNDEIKVKLVKFVDGLGVENERKREIKKDFLVLKKV